MSELKPAQSEFTAVAIADNGGMGNPAHRDPVESLFGDEGDGRTQDSVGNPLLLL